MKEMNILQWQEKFAAGEFSAGDFRTQVDAGWYDWFCHNYALRNKTYKMGKIIAKVKPGGKIDLENWYVWFKNNCPCVGPLYDDFRFAIKDSGEVQFTICIDDKRAGSKYEVWGRRNDFSGPLAGFQKSRDLVKWLNTPWEE